MSLSVVNRPGRDFDHRPHLVPRLTKEFYSNYNSSQQTHTVVLVLQYYYIDQQLLHVHVFDLVKEGVELYLCSSCGHLWQVTGRNLLFTFVPYLPYAKGNVCSLTGRFSVNRAPKSTAVHIMSGTRAPSHYPHSGSVPPHSLFFYITHNKAPQSVGLL